ncbi:unnamed protein product, partial [Coregonus sp. 'balchen']
MLLNKILHTVGRLLDVIAYDYAHVQMSATVGTVQLLQVHLAYSLGSAIQIHADPKVREIGFLMIDNKNIYRLKSVLNVCFWQNDIHVKFHSPPMVAYLESNPDLYVTPNLPICSPTKDVHYLCPGKPLIRDNAERLCGIKPLSEDERCQAAASVKDDVTVTWIEIACDLWLVSTPADHVIVTYDSDDTVTKLPLLNQTFFISSRGSYSTTGGCRIGSGPICPAQPHRCPPVWGEERGEQDTQPGASSALSRIQIVKKMWMSQSNQTPSQQLLYPHRSPSSSEHLICSSTIKHILFSCSTQHLPAPLQPSTSTTPARRRSASPSQRSHS